MNETGSQSFYLGYQLLASTILMLAGIGVGIFLAWIIWGHIKYEVERTRARNRELRTKLAKLQQSK